MGAPTRNQEISPNTCFVTCTVVFDKTQRYVALCFVKHNATQHCVSSNTTVGSQTHQKCVLLHVLAPIYRANQKPHGPLVMLRRRVLNTFIKSSNTIHEIFLTHSAIASCVKDFIHCVGWLHSCVWDPSSQHNWWAVGYLVKHIQYLVRI